VEEKPCETGFVICKGVGGVNCKHEAVKLMHHYLDEDLNKENEVKLRKHLETCGACQKHFHELNRTISLIRSNERVTAPASFTGQVMNNLPTEKSHVKYTRWFKTHPILVTTAIFFLFLFSGIFSVWHQDNELVVSKQENLVVKGDTVIVPEGVTVSGDLFVKNGNLRVDGQVDGDVTLINGNNLASTGEVSGEWTHITKVFGWIWYQLHKLFEGIFSLSAILSF